jgi:subtilase family serine protease
MAGASRTATGTCVLALAALLGSSAPTSAGALAPVHFPPQVRVGELAALPAGARRAGTLAPSTPLHLTIALKPRDPQALAAYARSVATPGSTVYRGYLKPRQFARRFGASKATLDAVRASLRRHGLSPGVLSDSALSISVTARASAITHAFSLSFARLALPGRRAAITASAPPSFDAGVARSIQAVFGLSSVSRPHPLLRRPVRAGTRSSLARSDVVTGGPQPCPAARAAAPAQSAYTADQVASAYGLPGLYGAGDSGAGVTVAVYELEPDDPADIAAYQSCYGTHASVSDVHVDGGAGGGAGSGEAALDIENVIGIAPAARVLVYQGPNSATGSAYYDTYRAIVDQDLAQVVTTSWGQCEPAVDPSAARAENALFEQAAVQGQTIIAAGGDDGSEDCNGNDGLPDPSLQVEDPASQPFVTGVGGTTLLAGPPRAESVWNSGGNLASALSAPGAGGGGVSSFWPMPADQRAAPASLHVVQADSSGVPCGQAGGLCREVPDVSADADPSTGYLIYWNGAGSVATQPSGWQGIGGTSGAAPTWAAVIALADATRGCTGAAIGFANPALYRAAASAYGSGFNDISSGENDFTGTGGGRYPAGAGYDMASGLGTPNAAGLANSLCAASIRLTNPGPQLSTVRTAVSLRIVGTDAGGFTPSYRASGLPPGLSIKSSTGRISGKPRRTGTYAVTVLAGDRGGAVGHTAFAWSVRRAPRASAVSLLAGAGGRLRLSFSLAAARGAPAIRAIAVKLPGGLSFRSARRIEVRGVHAKRLRYSSRLSRGRLMITLRRSAGAVRVVVPYPQLRATPNVVSGRTRRLSLKLSVTDASAGVTQLAPPIARGR